MKATITKIRPSHEGEEISLSLEIIDEKGLRRENFNIAAQYFAEISLPSFSDEKAEIDEEKLAAIRFLALQTEAIRAGLRLLEFSFNTKKNLRGKLIRRGFPGEIADAAIAFFDENGYIDEAGQAQMLAEELAEKKKYGKTRIKTELFAKGFDGGAIRDALENCEADYAHFCAERIKAMGGKEIFAEPKSKQKAVAALIRYGYSYDDIREALRSDIF